MSALPPQLRVTTTHDVGVDLLELDGDLDLTTVAGLREIVFDPTRCVQPLLVLVLDGLDFLDSQGIATLVATRRRVVERGGELVLVCSQPHLLKLLRISRLDTVLRVADSVEAVLRDDGVA